MFPDQLFWFDFAASARHRRELLSSSVAGSRQPLDQVSTRSAGALPVLPLSQEANRGPHVPVSAVTNLCTAPLNASPQCTSDLTPQLPRVTLCRTRVRLGYRDPLQFSRTAAWGYTLFVVAKPTH